MQMTELEKAKADMDYYRHKGGFGYRQAKKRYDRLLRKERKNGPDGLILGEQAEIQDKEAYTAD